MERVEGIEPSLSGRKHDILPLNYTRITLYIYYTIKKTNRQVKNTKKVKYLKKEVHIVWTSF